MMRSVTAKVGQQLVHIQRFSQKHGPVPRSDFASLSDTDLAFYEKLLGKQNVITDAKDVEPYCVDWLKIYRSSASPIVLRPQHTEQVSAILSHCSSRRLALCPQGGNTGLVGGSTPVHDETVLSMSAMNSIENFDQISGVLTCEAGCILETLESHVNDHDHMMPLDLGAKGTCQIGGNLATNAGGIRLIRYGSLHAHTLGLEVVLPDGTVVSNLSQLRKDNTGLHLPHMFIGSEGTLGVITKAVLTCPTKPTDIALTFLGCSDFKACLQLLHRARTTFQETLSSYEFLDHECVQCNVENLGLSSPLSSKHPCYIILELAGSSAQGQLEQRLLEFLDECMADNLVQDGTVAADQKQSNSIWEIRERSAEGALKDGYVYKFDFSLPGTGFYEVVEATRSRLSSCPSANRIVAFGHLGDGNVHLNVTSRQFSPEVQELLFPWVYQWVAEHAGSISAEHGVGQEKLPFMHLAKSPAYLATMQIMKRSLDPHNILNPYKLYPSL